MMMKRFAFTLFCAIAPLLAHAEAMRVEELTTPSGISVWRVEDNTTPSETISFAFTGGSELDPHDKQGLTYLMAALLTEGAGTDDSASFAQKLTEKNISLNISAGRDAITGDVRFLLTHTDDAVALTKAALTQPRFEADDIARLQDGLLANFRQTENDPSWRATRLLFQEIFGGTPYAMSSRGTPATIPAITHDDLRNALAQRLVKKRLNVVAVGAAPADDVEAITDRIFADLPEGDSAPRGEITLKRAGETWFNEHKRAPQAVVQFALPGISPQDDDYLPALVLNDIVGGGGFRARMMKDLRQSLGATYGVGMNFLNFKQSPFIYGQTTVALPQLDAAMHIIRDNVAKAAAGTVDADELQASKTYLAGAFARDLTSSGAIADFILGARTAGLPSDYYATYPDRIMAITPDDIARVGKRLFDPAALRFAIVAPQAPSNVTRTITDLWSENP